MASAIPNSAKANLMNGTIDLDTNTIKARLVMSNTTCDTEVDGITHLSNYTNIDPSDATGYADVTLTVTVAAVDASDWAKFDANDISFTGLSGNATRDYQGILIYKYVDGTNANDIPVCFVDFGGNIAKTATQVDVTFDAAGIMKLA